MGAALHKKTSIRQSIIILLLIVSFKDAVHAQYPKVEIQNTQLRKITSSFTRQNFLLYIHLPESYGTREKHYPVLYLLDGHWLFPMVTGLYGNEYGDAAIPEMIIVGITWDGKDPNIDSLRQSNYSPTKVKDIPGSGNAPNFLRFIKQELIPFVESNYRAERDDRILMGGSLGGLFVGYTIFHETNLFKRYIMASPVLDWDNEILFKHETSYFEKTSTLDAKIFIAGGEEDYGISDIKQFSEQLKSRNYKGLYLKTIFFKELGHAGTTSDGFNLGLKDLFAKPFVSLDTTVMDEYVGTYQRKQDDEFKLFRKGTGLMMQYSEKIAFPLYAETAEDFYIKGVFILLKFTKSDSDKIEGVNVNYGSGEGYYKKIN